MPGALTIFPVLNHKIEQNSFLVTPASFSWYTVLTIEGYKGKNSGQYRN